MASILASSAFAVDMNEQDKQYHFEACSALQASGSLILKNKFKMSSWEAGFYSAVGTMLIGAAKEYAIDKQADPKDLQADAMGVSFAFPIVFVKF